MNIEELNNKINKLKELEKEIIELKQEIDTNKSLLLKKSVNEYIVYKVKNDKNRLNTYRVGYVSSCNDNVVSVHNIDLDLFKNEYRISLTDRKDIRIVEIIDFKSCTKEIAINFLLTKIKNRLNIVME